MKRVSRRWSAAVVTVVFGLMVGCGDKTVEPSSGEDAEVQLEGKTYSRLWQYSGAEPHFLGSVQSVITIRQRAGKVEASARNAFATSGADDDPPIAGAEVPPLAALGRGRLRPVVPQALARRPLTFQTSDGKSLRYESVADPRGGGRPPVAGLVFQDDRVVSMTLYRYRRDGRRFIPRSAKATLFDETGRPSLVVEHDYQSLTSSLATTDLGSDGVRAYLAQAGERLAGLVLPRRLEAAADASAMQDEECMNFEFALGLAVAAESAALVNLAAKIAACLLVNKFACPAVVTAVATAAAATAALIAANHLLNECWNGDPDPDPLDESGDADSEMVTEECWEIDWYVSYDDGLTWEYIGTTGNC